MADSVQVMLEGMLPELEDFQKRGIFTSSEVKGIIARRRHFEYLLHGRSPNKIDYLRYVEYELNLDRLRRLRKSRLGIKKKNTVSEHAITRRIFGIFDRALRRFPGDVNLWKQYLDMARSSRSYKAVSRIFGRALQLHPSAVSLWISAASWEFTHENNMQAARALLHRGLRVNPGNVRLYLQLIRLELLYMLKLRERKRLLSAPRSDETVESLESGAADAGDSADEDALSSDDDERGRGRQQKKSFNAEASVMNEEFYRCALPRAVFQNAIAEIPDDTQFRVDVLRLYQQFEGTEAGQKDVCDSLERDFSTNESMCAVRARCHFDALPANADASLVFAALQEAMTMMDAFVDELETADMYDLYMDLFEDALPKLRATKYLTPLVAHWVSVCQRAVRAQLASPLLLSKYVWVLLQQGKFEDALSVARQSVELHPTSTELWSLVCRLTIARTGTWWQPDLPGGAQRVARGGGEREVETTATWLCADPSLVSFTLVAVREMDVETIKRDFVQGLSKLSSRASAPLWREYADALVAANSAPALVMGVLLQGAVQTVDESLLLAALNYALCACSVTEARGLYKQVLERVIKVPLSFYTACVAMERMHGTIDKVRDLCEHACAHYGAIAEDLWLEYALAETAAGNHEKAQHVVWRAARTLTNSASFTQRYNELRIG